MSKETAYGLKVPRPWFKQQNYFIIRLIKRGREKNEKRIDERKRGREREKRERKRERGGEELIEWVGNCL